jgi:hypothetical protein
MKRFALGPLVATAAAIVWCARYSRPLIDPFTLEVVFRDDWAAHSLGWLFFRNQSFFALPLGKIANFIHPLGSTVGYQDAIPWVALLLRPFSAIMPLDFQYLGLWVLACSASLAFVAARLARHLTPHWEQQALIGTFAAMSPSLMARIMHPALCSHGLIVAALALNLLRGADLAGARRITAFAIGLAWLTAATNPYVTLMVVSLAIAVPFQQRHALGLRASCAATAGMLAGIGAIFSLLGYTSGGMRNIGGGFGTYSSNLNTLWNSMGHSRLFAPLPVTQGQYEGCGYLGAGVFFFGVVALALFLVPALRTNILALPWRRIGWPLFATLACGVYALASPVRFGDRELLRIDAYRHINSLVEAFRSSGRFIWPLQYAIVLFVALLVAQALRSKRAWLTATLLIGVAIQAYDINPADAASRFAGKRHRPFLAAQWSLAARDYKHLVLFPAEIMNNCRGPKGYRGPFVTELAYLAYRYRWTTNSGYSARARVGTKEYCEQLKADVGNGKLEPHSIYIVDPHDVKALRKRGAICGKIDKIFACVRASQNAFATYLGAHRR